MNKTQKERLFFVANQNKNIMLNMVDWTEMVVDIIEKEGTLRKAIGMTFNFNEETRHKGLYGTIDGATCYCSNLVKEGYIRVSNIDKPRITDENDWSSEMLME